MYYCPLLGRVGEEGTSLESSCYPLLGLVREEGILREELRGPHAHVGGDDHGRQQHLVRVRVRGGVRGRVRVGVRVRVRVGARVRVKVG